MKNTTSVIVVALAALLTACWDRSAEENEGPAGFDGTFPASLSWDFQQPVSIDIEVAAELLPEDGAGMAEVRRAGTNALVFRAPLEAANGGRWRLSTVLPRAEEALTVIVETRDGRIGQTIDIEEGAARIRFE